uniref:Uncharacterized protein n=1 Tax=Romanomermis culicivorax TaxID=13658 RepID=A0A915JP55_ROMCU
MEKKRMQRNGSENKRKERKMKQKKKKIRKEKRKEKEGKDKKRKREEKKKRRKEKKKIKERKEKKKEPSLICMSTSQCPNGQLQLCQHYYSNCPFSQKREKQFEFYSKITASWVKNKDF